MKKLILFSLFLSLTLNLFSQTRLVINEINVSNIEPNLSDSIFDGDEEEGPLLHIKCSILNNTNNDLKLVPSELWILCSINYKNKTYQKDLTTFSFGDNDSLVVPSGGKIEFSVASHIFLGTPLWNQRKDNYTNELIEALPTLQIYYQDPRNKLYSQEIQNVFIK